MFKGYFIPEFSVNLKYLHGTTVYYCLFEFNNV